MKDGCFIIWTDYSGMAWPKASNLEARRWILGTFCQPNDMSLVYRDWLVSCSMNDGDEVLIHTSKFTFIRRRLSPSKP